LFFLIGSAPPCSRRVTIGACPSSAATSNALSPVEGWGVSRMEEEAAGGREDKGEEEEYRRS